MSHRVPEEIEALWVKAVDGLLTEAEAEQLEAFLEKQPELLEELEMDMQIKATTDGLTSRIMEDARIEPARPSPQGRSVLGLGFLFVFTGLAIVFGVGLHALLTDPEVPGLVRAGVVLAGFGVATLFGYVVRMRLRAVGRDPYAEVDR